MDKRISTENRAKRTLPLGVIRCLVAFVGITLALHWPQVAQAQTETQAETTVAPASVTPVNVTIEAPTHVAPGQAIPITLRLPDTTPVAAFEAELRYDPTAAEFAAFSPALPQATGVGRLILPDMASGAIVGAYTCATDPCLAQRTMQAQAATADPSVLAVVEVLPLLPGTLEIAVDHLRLVDATGNPLPVTLAQSTLTVQVGEATDARVAPASLRTDAADATVASATSADAVTAAMADVTQDGSVSHADVMEVALAWQVSREDGSACSLASPQIPDPRVDINADGCVDVVDVQLAAALADSPSGIPTTPEQPSAPTDPSELPNQLYVPFLRAGEEATAALADNAEAAVAQTAAGLTFIVNSTLDESNATWGQGKCETPSGVCTLRAAIAESNAQPGPNTILFNIPGGGVQTIQLNNRLPTLRDESGPTVIDGYSQPGAAPNSDPLISNAKIRIEVRGYGSENFDAMAITSAGNTVQGLAIFNVKRAIWIYGAGAHDNVIAGDFIGTDATGTFQFTTTSSKQAHGLHVEQGAHNNLIGGVDPSARNIVAGNGRHGLGFWHVGTNQNIVLNNIFGLSPDGQRSLSNRIHGVDINFGASFNRVGGTAPGEHNVMSGNNGAGAEISHTGETSDNEIIGNYIGTDASGNAAPAYAANGGYGISLKDRVTDNLVTYNVVGNSRSGGVFVDNFGNCCTSGNVLEHNRIGVGTNDAAIGNSLFGIALQASQNRIGPGNLIAHNPVGVQLQGSESFSNTITANAIFANEGLGIDITPLGESNLSDPNLPVLQQVDTAQAIGTTCGNCAVEIFIADEGAGAYGEGKTLVGTGTAAPDGSFTVALTGAQNGDALTAVATVPNGGSTEFGANKVIGAAPEPWEQVFAIPGRIEAEDYRVGGEGTAYHDTSAGNNGGAYRNDDVDIEPVQDTSGAYNTGWTQPGEWLSYDVNIAQAGTYQVIVRVATPSGSRRMHLEIDGVDVSGPITIPWTGGWQTWRDVSATVTLPAGTHTLRVVAETDRFNLNYYEFTLTSP